jgi:hypothetical protein
MEMSVTKEKNIVKKQNAKIRTRMIFLAGRKRHSDTIALALLEGVRPARRGASTEVALGKWLCRAVVHFPCGVYTPSSNRITSLYRLRLFVGKEVYFIGKSATCLPIHDCWCVGGDSAMVSEWGKPDTI